jgi:hypothetical protein
VRSSAAIGSFLFLPGARASRPTAPEADVWIF